jgi:hypothetical protein
LQTNNNVLKKINYLLSVTFLLLSLSIWATESPKNSIKGFFVSNSETFFIQENTASNLLTNDLIGAKAIASPTNISNKKFDTKQLKVSETKLKISNFNSGKLASNLYIKPNATTIGLDYFYVKENNQTEKYFSTNQFYNIQGNLFISTGTIFYIEGAKNKEFQSIVLKNHQFKNEFDELKTFLEEKQSKQTTVTKSLPFSGNSFWGFYSTKFATAPNLKNENKTLNYIFVVTHQKSFFDFNYQENNCIAIANQGAIQINFCKYCFSLPPPSEKI